MPLNTQTDSQEFTPIAFPYNRIEAELSEIPRFIRGLNMYVTLGGKLSKRPGTLQVDSTGLALRMDRAWIVETLETPPKVYIVGSFYNPGVNRWQIWYNRPTTATGWLLAPDVRSMQTSIAAQEAVVSRGLLYVRSIPDPASLDKLGTAIFDGSGTTTTFKLWGVQSPTEGVHMSGATTLLNGAINNATTTIVVSHDFVPPVATNYVINVEYEQMLVTAAGGTSWTVTRGVNGTTATAHADKTLVFYHDWTASTHSVNVTIGWKYVYVWKSVTEQISCRSPLETNFDLMPSNTGPFFDQIPKMTVQGNADTTQLPFIEIYRSTDGGGTYFFLEEIPNTGAGDITYYDDSFESGSAGGVFNDPVPDANLDQGNISPSLLDHLPPPPVIFPQVLGVDPPVQGTPPTTYSGRIWYSIGNILFYSAQDEILEGIPEESWPGGVNGNFYRFPFQVSNIAATTNALYIFTIQNTYVLTGNNRETFNVRQLFDNLGAPYGQPRSVTRFADKLALLTQDFRLAVISGDDEPLIYSDPLYTDFIDQINLDTTNMQVDIKYWADLDKEWIVVAIHDLLNPVFSKQWVLDLKLTKKTGAPFWFVPWQIPSTCLYSNRLYEGNTQRRLCFWNWLASPSYGQFIRLDPTGRTPTDTLVTGVATTAVTGISYYMDTFLQKNPTGNHVNTLRNPGLTSIVGFLAIERTLTPGDEVPEFFGYFDDFWTDPVDLEPPEPPARREPSKAYATEVVQIWQACYRFAFRISKVKSISIQEFQSYALTWNPDSGA